MEQELIAAGWHHEEHEGLICHLGGLWHRRGPEGPEIGFVAQDFHANRNGVVHGGLLMTFMDRALGMAARDAGQAQRGATVSLNHQFLAPLQIGEFAVITARVQRVTGRMVFMEGALSQGGTLLVSAQGVWRVTKTP